MDRSHMEKTAWRLAENQKPACFLTSFAHISWILSLKSWKQKNTDIAVIPGGLTSVLQPLDVSLNKPFKDNVRTLWMEWMAGDHSENKYTKSGQ